jgi:hypothetical protein
VTWIASSKCSPPPGEIRVQCKAKNCRRLVRLCELRYICTKNCTSQSIKWKGKKGLYFSYLTICLYWVVLKNRIELFARYLNWCLPWHILYIQDLHGLGSRQRKCSAEYLLDFAKFCRFNPQFLRHLQDIYMVEYSIMKEILCILGPKIQLYFSYSSVFTESLLKW